MNLTVEWVSPQKILDEHFSTFQVPVIRVAALRRWLEEMKREEIARTANDDRIMLLDDLLAQLPEA